MGIQSAQGSVVTPSGSAKVPQLKLSKLNMKKKADGMVRTCYSSLFDLDKDDFETVVVGSFKDSADGMNRQKLLAFMKLVGTLEKKIMLRKIDFWLPLRVNH